MLHVFPVMLHVFCVMLQVFLVMLHVSCNVARVSCNVAHVSCNVAGVSCNVARVLCNVAHVSCNVSGNTCNITRNTCSITRVRVRVCRIHKALFGLWFTTTFHASTFSLSASQPYLATLPQWNIHCVHKKEASSFFVITIICLFDIYYFCTWITLTVANSIIKFNHHICAALTLWWRICNVDRQNAVFRWW